MQETDMAGYPQRKQGDKLVIDSRKVVVMSVMKPQVLCPCPDELVVQYQDCSEAKVTNGSFDTWE